MENKIALIEEKAWFTKLIEDCQGKVLSIKKTSWDVVVGYHDLGKRLADDKETFWKQDYTTQEMLDIVAEQVGRSRSTLYTALRFYEKYPDLQLSPYTEDTNWFQIIKDLREKKKEIEAPKDAEMEEDQQEKQAESSQRDYSVLGVSMPVFDLVKLVFDMDDAGRQEYFDSIIGKYYGDVESEKVLKQYKESKNGSE